jgi:hypothetical protein
MGRFFSIIRAKALGYALHRRIRVRLFSGSPVLVHVYRRQEEGEKAWSLLYKNGLLLTLGEAGILDYQDPRFAHFMGARDTGRTSLVQLHRIVLKSLLKYLVHPRIDVSQRENASEAASVLWMAWEEREDWTPVSLDAPIAHRRASGGDSVSA